MSGVVYGDGAGMGLEELATLRERSGFGNASLGKLRKQIDGASRVVTARDGARLVGFARCLTDGVSNGYVSSVMVDPEYQRRGVGREMMKRLMGDDPGIRWVLHTRAEAREFYASLGYEDASDIMWRDRR